VNASVSGCNDALPELLICAKIGDSRSLSRMYNEIATRMMEIRNGILQPQALKSSLLIDACVTRITSNETNNPSVAVIWMKLV